MLIEPSDLIEGLDNFASRLQSKFWVHRAGGSILGDSVSLRVGLSI